MAAVGIFISQKLMCLKKISNSEKLDYVQDCIFKSVEWNIYQQKNGFIETFCSKQIIFIVYEVILYIRSRNFPRTKFRRGTFGLRIFRRNNI